MPDNFDMNDFDGGRRKPRLYMRKLNESICNGERGYHAALRDRIAGLLAMTYVALENYKVFCKWSKEKCLEDDTKLLSATKDNFRSHAARCVVTLGCYGSDILPSTRSKCLTVIKDLVAMEVEPEDCADFIKAKGGFEEVYQEAKEKRVVQKTRAADAKLSSRNVVSGSFGGKGTYSQTPTSAKLQTDEARVSKPNKRKLANNKSPKTDGGPLTVEEILANYLLIKMPTEELDQYRDKACSRGEERGIQIMYNGRKRKGLHIWEYVSELEVEGPSSPGEDNDNDVDNGDEDAA